MQSLHTLSKPQHPVVNVRRQLHQPSIVSGGGVRVGLRTAANAAGWKELIDCISEIQGSFEESNAAHFTRTILFDRPTSPRKDFFGSHQERCSFPGRGALLLVASRFHTTAAEAGALVR